MMTAKKIPMLHDKKVMFLLDKEQNKHGIDFKGLNAI